MTFTNHISLHLNALYRLTLAAIAQLTITLPSSTKQPSKKALIVPMLLALLIAQPASAGHWGSLGSSPVQYLQSPSERSANAYASSGVCQESKR